MRPFSAYERKLYQPGRKLSRPNEFQQTPRSIARRQLSTDSTTVEIGDCWKEEEFEKKGGGRGSCVWRERDTRRISAFRSSGDRFGDWSWNKRKKFSFVIEDRSIGERFERVGGSSAFFFLFRGTLLVPPLWAAPGYRKFPQLRNWRDFSSQHEPFNHRQQDVFVLESFPADSLRGALRLYRWVTSFSFPFFPFFSSVSFFSFFLFLLRNLRTSAPELHAAVILLLHFFASFEGMFVREIIFES